MIKFLKGCIITCVAFFKRTLSGALFYVSFLITTLFTMNLQAPICGRVGCGKPCFTENGFTHPYCGRTCATVASIFFLSLTKCAYPTCSNPAYVDQNGKRFLYCGRTCTIAAANDNNRFPTCARLACNNRVYVNQGVFYKYCGLTCVAAARNENGSNCARIGCARKAWKNPTDKDKDYSFCSLNCYRLDGSDLTATKITLLDPKNIDYINAKREFLAKLNNANVDIKAILRLQMPKAKLDAHLALKQKMGGAVHKMYHGTQSSCDQNKLIKKLTPCSGACGMCGIIKEGNKTSCSRQPCKGMWFADTPVTSYSYCGGGTMRAIFMVDVLAPQASSILIIRQDEATLPRYLVLSK